MITIGVLISSVLGNIIDWRLAAGLFSIPSVLMTAFMFFMPESPTHLIFSEEVSEKRIAEARQALSRLRSDDSTIDQELQQLLQSKQQLPTYSVSFFKRFQQVDFFKPFMYSMGLMLLQQFSGNFLDQFVFSGLKRLIDN